MQRPIAREVRASLQADNADGLIEDCRDRRASLDEPSILFSSPLAALFIELENFPDFLFITPDLGVSVGQAPERFT